jgi:hypothetical protein
MALEKEDIVLDLITRLWTHPDNPIVTEDWSKAATLEHFPTVFVIERDDEVVNLAGLTYGRECYVSTVSFVEGHSSESAPAHLRAFQKQLRQTVYKDRLRKIGQYGGGIREFKASQILHPPMGNNIVAQEIIWRIIYKEDVVRVFEVDVVPTE